MTLDLELTVLQDARDDHGYVASFAVTDELIIAAGGTSNVVPTLVASSNARHFELRKTPRQLGLRDVLAVGDAVWTCGEYGQLAMSRDHGASWKLFDTGTDACLFSLALAPDDAIWVVGNHGYAARVANERLERVEFATSTRFTAAYATGGEIVVLGCDGALYRWRDGQVTKVGTGAAQQLNALAISKLGTWVVVGDGGFIARSPDGTWFSRVKSDVELDLEGLAVGPDGTLIAVGDRGIILISSDDGRHWQPRATQLTAHLWSVERFGNGVLIGGDAGLIAKLAPPGDHTWQDRVNLFGGAQPLDVVFAGGPDGFIAKGLGDYLDVISAPRRDEAGERDLAGRFATIYGLPLPPEVETFLAAVSGRDQLASFADLRLDRALVPAGDQRNLFEAYLGSGLVDAFCGAFCIGSQPSGDTYHMELYEWDGPRQVLHYDHQTRAFTGVLADSLDSLAYFAALKLAKERAKISDEAFEVGLLKLHGKIAPSLDAKRRDTEFFFYRSQWISALLDGAIVEIPRLFNADFNQVVPQDQLPARYEACEKFIPTALYSMWRAYLFDEPELVPYLEVGRRHHSRLVRDAAVLLDDLRSGRNELGTIKDVRAHLAAFRALDLDPRRADVRKAEREARVKLAATRSDDVAAELARTPPGEWAELAWRWLDDGVAHRMLLARLADRPEVATELAALAELARLPDAEREVALPRLAETLSPEVEALLVGSLVRGDPDEPDERDDARQKPVRADAALAMSERAMRLTAGDSEIQFTHAMLLLDADRLDDLVALLPSCDIANRINIAVRLGKHGHPRFADVLDIVLRDQLPERIIGADDSEFMASYGDVAEELLSQLAEAALEHAPDQLAKLVPALPLQVNLLSALAWKAIQADQRDHALALYDRLLAIAIPAAGDERTNYLRAINNACVQAHAAKAYDLAVRIADRAQPVAHENPYIYHSAACAYAAVGDHAKAFEQVKLAVAHNYDHLAKVEIDSDLGPLLEWPEFKALFRTWRAHKEGN